MSTIIKHAYKSHNTWIYRRAYPQHLKGALGASLKQSLKTPDAKLARQRVAELNVTFTNIIREAQAHATPTQPTAQEQSSRLDVAVPRYQRLRLLGQRLLIDLAADYLGEAASRLRPGSYKSVRFALELLVSHLGQRQIRDVTFAQGREVLTLISQLTPNIRKYREAKEASLKKLAALSEAQGGIPLTGQTQARILWQMLQFFDWCVHSGELLANPWVGLQIKAQPEVTPHGVLTDEQVTILLHAKDRVLHTILLFCLLTGMRSGEACGLTHDDIVAKGNLGRFVMIRPNAIRQLKSRAAEREVPLHPILEQLLDAGLPKHGRLFPLMTVDRVVKAYARLRRLHPELHGTVFHSTRKWFITQCERTGVPEHFTASLVGHEAARSANKLTYRLYSAGISDAQKREIVDGVRLPER
jgi:integrase